MQCLNLTDFGLLEDDEVSILEDFVDDEVSILEEFVDRYRRVGEESGWEEGRKKDGKYGL